LSPAAEAEILYECDWEYAMITNQTVLIEKILLDNDTLYVKPTRGSFSMIYRAAMAVYWSENKDLYYNHPLKRDTLSCYGQILKVIKSEYGVTLKLHSQTLYENINSDTKRAIESNDNDGNEGEL
jgi:hypothetical protein